MNLTWRDMADVLIAWVVLYRLLVIIKGTRAVQMFAGVIILALASLLAQVLDLSLLNWVLRSLWAAWLLAFIILFQPELRKALARIGQGPVWEKLLGSQGQINVIDELVEASAGLAQERIGAIIVIERNAPLQEFISAGVRLDARVSAALLRTLFTPHSPLHDGAIVIQGQTIAAAGCILPLTQRTDRSEMAGMGTRHSAGLGVTEENDSISIIVSEETGQVSIAVGGRLTRGLDPKQMKKVLSGLVVPRPEKKTRKRRRSAKTESADNE